MTDKQFLEELGKRIATLRKRAGHTQVSLSKKLDMDRAALAKIETGRVNPQINTLRRIANGLNISLLDLLKM